MGCKSWERRRSACAVLSFHAAFCNPFAVVLSECGKHLEHHLAICAAQVSDRQVQTHNFNPTLLLSAYSLLHVDIVTAKAIQFKNHQRVASFHLMINQRGELWMLQS